MGSSHRHPSCREGALTSELRGHGATGRIRTSDHPLTGRMLYHSATAAGGRSITGCALPGASASLYLGRLVCHRSCWWDSDPLPRPYQDRAHPDEPQQHRSFARDLPPVPPLTGRAHRWQCLRSIRRRRCELHAQPCYGLPLSRRLHTLVVSVSVRRSLLDSNQRGCYPMRFPGARLKPLGQDSVLIDPHSHHSVLARHLSLPQPALIAPPTRSGCLGCCFRGGDAVRLPR